jgi:hypothetical protein
LHKRALMLRYTYEYIACRTPLINQQTFL